MNVDTGKFTGRSAKDKYIVKDDVTKEFSMVGRRCSANKPMSPSTWTHLKSLCLDSLTNKKLYVIDGYCGATKDTRIAVRLITEVAWQAHFFKNMFIRPTEVELSTFQPSFTIINACRTS